MMVATSNDGTRIAFDRSGSGPALVLVGGALSDRSGAASLAPLLAEHFTVYAFDRRGRGDSGDTPPYSPEREVDDIAALLDGHPGPAYIYGHSSGSALALDAAEKLRRFERIAVYEPPFIIDSGSDRPSTDYIGHISELLRGGDRGGAVEYFLTVAVGIPSAALEQIKRSAAWQRMESLAHTLPYEGALMGSTQSGHPLPRDRWSHVTIPTLVMNGGASPAWFSRAADALAALLPNARRQTFADQHHGVASSILAPILIEHFLAGSGA